MWSFLVLTVPTIISNSCVCCVTERAFQISLEKIRFPAVRCHLHFIYVISPHAWNPHTTQTKRDPNKTECCSEAVLHLSSDTTHLRIHQKRLQLLQFHLQRMFHEQADEKGKYDSSSLHHLVHRHIKEIQRCVPSIPSIDELLDSLSSDSNSTDTEDTKCVASLNRPSVVPYSKWIPVDRNTLDPSIKVCVARVVAIVPC